MPTQTLVVLLQWTVLHHVGAFADESANGRNLGWMTMSTQDLTALKEKGDVVVEQNTTDKEASTAPEGTSDNVQHEGATCCEECGWESKYCKGTMVVDLSSNSKAAPTLTCQDIAEKDSGLFFCYRARRLSEVLV